MDMEMRGGTGAIVYYRGGKLLTINEKMGLVGLDKKYCLKDEREYVTPELGNILAYIYKAKNIMDKYEMYNSKLGEKEIQQRTVYENNLSVNADNTDYFIVDVEWADNNSLGGRADIVAFKWNHMNHKNRSLKLALIEVKQGEHAIKTTEMVKNGIIKLKPGLRKHYEDYRNFLKDKEYVRAFADDMMNVLKQKKQLGLIKGLEKLFTDGKKDIVPTIDDDVDFVFLLANYHHYSKQLREECETLPEDCKFFVSSFMGYGLYEDLVFTKDEVKNIFPMTFLR